MHQHHHQVSQYKRGEIIEAWFAVDNLIDNVLALVWLSDPLGECNFFFHVIQLSIMSMKMASDSLVSLSILALVGLILTIGMVESAPRCEACGPSCVSVCGTASFRACCYNFNKRSSSSPITTGGKSPYSLDLLDLIPSSRGKAKAHLSPHFARFIDRTLSDGGMRLGVNEEDIDLASDLDLSNESQVAGYALSGNHRSRNRWNWLACGSENRTQCLKVACVQSHYFVEKERENQC